MSVFVLISHGSPTSVTSGILFCICSLVCQNFYFAFARLCMEAFLMCVTTKVRVVHHEIESVFFLGLTFSSLTARVEIVLLLLYPRITYFCGKWAMYLE